MTRLGINGFGRMGRLAFRAAWDRSDLEIVHVNEIKGGAKTAAHLLEFDSVHGRWIKPITSAQSTLAVGGRNVVFSDFPKPGDVPWEASGVEIILECTGKFVTPELLSPYFERNVAKIVVATPVKQGALNIVMGVNDDEYDPKMHNIITAASCTTNCLAPIVKVIHDNLGIKHGSITTVHDVTNTQTMVDAPHKDLRRARSALTSLIPTTTGSATAITMIYPELKGRLNGVAVRVPLLNASLTDCVFEVDRPTTIQEVNALLKSAAEGSLKNILGYEERPLVSVDFVNDPHSSIIDAPSTMVINGTQVKILAWYDNEWGYVNRMVELTAKIAATLPSRAE